MKNKRTLNFLTDRVKTIEKISIENSSYDYHTKVDNFPEFREKFRHLAKIKGAYTPIKINNFSYKQDIYATPPPPKFALEIPDDYSQENIPNWAVEENLNNFKNNNESKNNIFDMYSQFFNGNNSNYSQNKFALSKFSQLMLRGAIHPDRIFDTNEIPRNIVIQNVTEGPVVISLSPVAVVGRSNVEDFENKNYIKIESFKSIDQIPNKFFTSIQFKNAFYSKPPSLIFITEKQYRERLQIVHQKKEYEMRRDKEMKDRIENRGHNVGHYKDNGERTAEDIVAQYGSQGSRLAAEFDIADDIRHGQVGLTQYMQEAYDNDGVMSEEEIGSFLRSFNS